eukprot:CAMPEP_0197237738 /NCGR_PEP_ID=MMETSP1429-20130617/4486_1 /TAXON_ID=49237 /ORGANISM="Chaetoceros  sp., Strain UNC1202" /LENGTH=234 /DNA_ID=CAMNT_0042696793 /DNA_START=24 /DNA_END=728 /DNA_ORIENTATION=-
MRRSLSLTSVLLSIALSALVLISPVSSFAHPSAFPSISSAPTSVNSTDNITSTAPTISPSPSISPAPTSNATSNNSTNGTDTSFPSLSPTVAHTPSPTKWHHTASPTTTATSGNAADDDKKKKKKHSIGYKILMGILYIALVIAFIFGLTKCYEHRVRIHFLLCECYYWASHHLKILCVTLGNACRTLGRWCSLTMNRIRLVRRFGGGARRGAFADGDDDGTSMLQGLLLSENT